MPSSRGSFQPRDRTQVSRIADGFFTIWSTKEVLYIYILYMYYIYICLYTYIFSPNTYWILNICPSSSLEKEGESLSSIPERKQIISWGKRRVFSIPECEHLAPGEMRKFCTFEWDQGSTIKEAMDPELIAVKFEKQVVPRKEKKEIFSTIIACWLFFA